MSLFRILISNLLFTTNAFAGDQPIKPIPVAIKTQPALATYIKEQVASEYKNAMQVLAKSLYDLNIKCEGAEVYANSYQQTKIKNAKGKPIEVAGLFTGSGGTTLLIYTLSKDKKKLNILFEEVVINFEGATEKKDCADIKVQVRDLNEKQEMAERETSLVYKNGKYVIKPIQ